MRATCFAVICTLFFLFNSAETRAQLLPAQPQQEKPAENTLSLALKYYEHCLDGTYKNFSANTRHDFCACTADLARKQLSTEEMKLLAEEKVNIPYFDPGKFEEKLNINVNAPCIHYVIKEFIYNNCLGSDRVMNFFVTQDALEGMCRCHSSNVTEFMRLYGKEMVAAMLARQPLVNGNLLGGISIWPDYNNEFSKWHEECLNAYAYK